MGRERCWAELERASWPKGWANRTIAISLTNTEQMRSEGRTHRDVRKESSERSEKHRSTSSFFGELYSACQAAVMFDRGWE